MNEEITKVIEAIAEDVLKLTQTIFADNNLSGSNLEKSLQVAVSNTNESIVIETLFDNYIEYIELGRKPRSGKQPPIDALRDWALAKGIPTDNSTLFLISRAIWRDGYEGRPILATLEEEIDRMMDDKWADQLMEAATNELIKYFE